MRLRFWKRAPSEIVRISREHLRRLEERDAMTGAAIREVSDTWSMKFSGEALHEFTDMLRANTLTNAQGDRLTFELKEYPDTREALFFVTQHYHGGCSCTHDDCPSPAREPRAEVPA